MNNHTGVAPDIGERRLPGKSIMPLLSLQRHWGKSILVFLLVAGIGLPVAWVKGTAKYYAEAVVHINFRFAPNLETHQEIEIHSIQQYERLVQHQLRTINRYDVVKRALDSLGQERQRWQRPNESEGQAVRRLQGALRVNAVRDTFLITIGLEDTDPTLIPLLVNPVVESYLATERREIFVGSDTRLDNLKKRKTELEGSIAAIGKELQQMASTLGITTFEERFMNPYDQILVDINDALAKARRARVSAKAELDALIEKNARLLEIPLDSEAEKLAANDRALGDLRTFLYKRRAELVQIMSGLKPSHAGRQAAELEIEQINEEIVATTEKTRREIKEILEERRRADIRVEEAEHRARFEQARKVEDALGVEVELRRQDVDQFVKVYTRARGVKEELDRQHRKLQMINDRIDFIEIEENAPGYARLVSLASVPELPISGGRKKLFVLFLVAATGLALILPLMLDFADSSIRTPNDLHRVLGFAPSAWLPEITSDEARVLFEEQAERLAIAVLRDIRTRDRGCSFLVTEPLPGSGKTRVIEALAGQLQRLGVAALAVSCDPASAASPGDTSPDEQPDRAPGDGADPGPQLGRGLTDLLKCEASPEQVLVPGGAAGADRIAFGSRAEAAQIHNTVRMNELVDELTLRYDIVLIDGPAILMSAAAEALSGICYGTLIIVEAVETPVKPLKRAASIIERAAPEVVGSVLNRTPLFRRGGHYRQLSEELTHYRNDGSAAKREDS